MDGEIFCYHLISGLLITLAVMFLDPQMPEPEPVLVANPSGHVYLNMYFDIAVNITVPKLPVISNLCMSFQHLKDSDLAPAALEHTGVLRNLPISSLKTSIRHWQSLGLISANESAWEIDFLDSSQNGGVGVMREHMNVIRRHKQVVRGKTSLVKSGNQRDPRKRTASILYSFQIFGFQGQNMDITRKSNCENGFDIFKPCMSQFVTTMTDREDHTFQEDVDPTYNFNEKVSAVHAAGQQNVEVEKIVVGCVDDLNGQLHPSWI